MDGCGNRWMHIYACIHTHACVCIYSIAEVRRGSQNTCCTVQALNWTISTWGRQGLFQLSILLIPSYHMQFTDKKEYCVPVSVDLATAQGLDPHTDRNVCPGRETAVCEEEWRCHWDADRRRDAGPIRQQC